MYRDCTDCLKKGLSARLYEYVGTNWLATACVVRKLRKKFAISEFFIALSELIHYYFCAVDDLSRLCLTAL